MDFTLSQQEQLMTAGPRNQRPFLYLAPIDMSLTVFILFQNSWVIFHLYKERSRYPSLLFMLIAICDVTMATSELARGSVALTCLKHKDTTIFPTLVLSYLSLGVICYQCSIFFNLVLTLLRTVQLINPLFRANYTLLKTTLLVFPLLVLCLMIGDIVCWNNVLDSTPSCYHHWVRVEAVSYLGEGMVVYFTEDRKERELVGGILLHFEYSLPCLVVLICMIMQIWYIKRGFAGEGGQNTARHASITVLLVSVLYFISNSAFVIVFTLSHAKAIHPSIKSYKILLMTVKFTLPLLNAALFPLIIILRKSSLRGEVKEMFRRILSLVGAGFTRMFRRILSLVEAGFTRMFRRILSLVEAGLTKMKTYVFGREQFLQLQEDVTEEYNEDSE